MRTAILALSALATASSFANLTQPVSLSMDSRDNSLVVGQLDGLVLRAPALSTPTGTLILNITTQVAAYGVMGLASAEVMGNYLYVIYDKPNGVYNNTACSTAIPSSTTDTAAAGCVSKGVLSRFAYANATVTGNEEVLATGSWCSQFTNAGMGDLKSHNGVLYVSAGVGSGESESVPADYGQFGGDPCGGGGAFRAQDDNSWDGKVMAFTVTPSTVVGNPPVVDARIVAKGIGNGWRLTFVNDTHMLVGDAGSFNQSVYGPFSVVPGAGPANFGYPCAQAGVGLPQYLARNASVCTALQSQGFAQPWFSYQPANGGHAALSALGYAGAFPVSQPTNSTNAIAPRVLVGDYVLSQIVSLNTAGGGLQTLPGMVWPSYILDTTPAYGVLYVDVVKGAVLPVPTPTPGGGVGPSSAAPHTSLAWGTAAITVAVLLALM